MSMPRRSGAGEAPPRIEQAVPEALRAVTLKALARDKTRRYQSVSALVADIEAYQSGFATGAEDPSLFLRYYRSKIRVVFPIILLLFIGQPSLFHY
jgi:hypothetical protein